MRGIDPESWTLVSPVLDRALELSPAEREPFLADLRSRRPEIAAMVVSLLASHEAALADGFLADQALDADVGLAGMVVGAWALERPLGAGGMGTVWLARRQDGRFEGVAAVKLVHLALLDQAGQDRFRREGTALARLSHPNIARLLDAGVTASGQPYLVLEHVEGMPIDRYADERRLDIEERLRLFLQVTDAVAHAHANLVVHRDLKPSNILVDHSGRVKLLDFGVAKLMASDATETDGRTEPTNRALTPAYAAPEQVMNEPVTVAADVFALGTLLYVLLSGHHPFEASLDSPIALMRAITEQDPLPMSRAASDEERAADRTPAGIANARGTTPSRLSAALRGELDTIVGTALKKGPAERYASVEALAGDLRRYLNHEPIAVRGDAWTYRLRKFLWRHAAGVSMAAVLTATLVAATAVTTNRMIEARKQRDEAMFQARRSEAAAEFMRYLVTQIGSTPMTMHEVLDRGRVALERQYAGEPEFVARMLLTLSGPYIDLGENEAAAEMARHALEIATRLDDPELLRAAHCVVAEDLAYAVDTASARDHLARARLANARLSEPADTPCVRAELQLARVENRLDDAGRFAERNLAELEKEGAVNTTQYTSALNNLAVIYNQANRLPEALATIRRFTEVTRRIGRDDTGPLVVSLQNEALYLRRLGRWQESAARFAEAMALAGRAGSVPGYLRVNHARLLVSLAQERQAVAEVAEARASGPLPPTFVATAHLTEALALAVAGEIDAARRALAKLEDPALRKALPGYHEPTIHLIEAMLAAGSGRTADARAIVARALEATGHPARSDPGQPELLESAARLALADGDVPNATRLAEEAIRAAERLFGTDLPNAFAGRARLTLGQSLVAAGRPAEAKRALTQAEAQLRGAAGDDHPWTREARERLAALP